LMLLHGLATPLTYLVSKLNLLKGDMT
jgi:hypothetical protein